MIKLNWMQKFDLNRKLEKLLKTNCGEFTIYNLDKCRLCLRDLRLEKWIKIFPSHVDTRLEILIQSNVKKDEYEKLLALLRLSGF